MRIIDWSSDVCSSDRPIEVSGIVSGELDFVINKYDVDLDVTLYEQRADGDYLQLADTYQFRASYARDEVNRHLLKRSEERRVGKECVRTCRSRVSQEH